MRTRSSQLFSIRQILIKRAYQPHGVQQVVVSRWREYRCGLIVETALRHFPLVTFVFPDGTSRSHESADLENFAALIEEAEKKSARMNRENNS